MSARPFAVGLALMVSACVASPPVQVQQAVSGTPVAPTSVAATTPRPSPTPTPVPTATPVSADALGRYRLAMRGLYVQFERPDSPLGGYWFGQAIQQFNDFDARAGTTVSTQIARQLDVLRAMGINTITYELRSTTAGGGARVPPDCPIGPMLGFRFPRPDAIELDNIVPFLDLIQSKGMRVILNLYSSHMDSSQRADSEIWLGSILNRIKDHPVIDLITFGGGTHLWPDRDSQCGSIGEPPLWYGPRSEAGNYVSWAIAYAHGLGIPYRKLSAEALVGIYGFEAEGPVKPGLRPYYTDGHLWSPIRALKSIFDDLQIPDGDRTYALSLYEQRKCAEHFQNAPGYFGPIACDDLEPDVWAEEMLQKVIRTAGFPTTGARIVGVEMGLDPNSMPSGWPVENAVESLAALLEKYGIDGGSFWWWVASSAAEEADTQHFAPAVKRRNAGSVYNPLQHVVADVAGYHLARIPNGSFNDVDPNGLPTAWTLAGSAGGERVSMTPDVGQLALPSRGAYALRLTSGQGQETITSARIAVAATTTYTTTANLRFSWTGDPNPSAAPNARPQVFIRISYFTASGAPSGMKASDVFRYLQEDATSGFGTFPVQYQTPPDARFVQLEFGAVRNGLPTAITLDVDNVR
jgi:hypothetical protein